MKRLLALLMALTLAVSLAACGSSSSSSGSSASSDSSDSGSASSDSGESSGDFAGSVTIGVIGPMTGSLAVYGTHIYKGASLAASQINAKGGVNINGEGYELIIEKKDDGADSTETLNAMNSYISDGIDLIIGSATSGTTSAITSVANSEGVLLLAPTSTADSLTTEMDYVFRTCFKDSFQGTLAAQFAKDQGFTKVGVVYCSADTYSAGLMDAFVLACEERGLDVVATESVASMTEADYTNQFSKMVAAGAELVLTPFYYDVMGPYLVIQARQAGFTGVLLGGDGVESTETTVPDGADMSVFNDLYYVNHYDPELTTNDTCAYFVETFNEEYGESPNTLSVLGYDCVLVIATGMENAGSTDAADIQAALSDTSVVYECATGSFSFDETGTPIKPGVLIGYSYNEGDDAITKTPIGFLNVE